MIFLVIAYSQQHRNKCAVGDEETDHMYTIAKALYDILVQDKRLSVYLIPRQDTGDDLQNLRNSIRFSNEFIQKNGGKGYHLELHSDAGGYAKGCSALYKSEAGKAFVTPIYNELADLTPTPDVGIRKRDDLGALNQTIAVSGIIEVAFHDNLQEAAWIHSNTIPIAVRIANGIYKSLAAELAGISPTPPKPTYTHEVVGSTHIARLNPMNLRAKLVKASGRELAKTEKNFINCNLFNLKTLNIVGWLISEGKVLNERREIGVPWAKQKGTVIVYRDGTVFAGLKFDSEIVKELDKIWFCTQGFNLFPVDLKKEGFPADVGRETDRMAIGYDGKDIVITYRPDSDATRAVQTMTNLGCKMAICLDSGLSSNMVLDGKAVITSDRVLPCIVTF
jgi:hypothetical protein